MSLLETSPAIIISVSINWYVSLNYKFPISNLLPGSPSERKKLLGMTSHKNMINHNPMTPFLGATSA